MTDEPDSPGTDPGIDTQPMPVVVPDPAPADTFTPVLQVEQQGTWWMISQERTAGDVQKIYLNPDEATQVAWTMLSPDPATEDETLPTSDTDGEFVQDAGSF